MRPNQSGNVQSSYGLRNPAVIAGMLAEALSYDLRVLPRLARGDIKPGRGVFRAANTIRKPSSINPGESFHAPSPGAGALATAIVATAASATTAQNLTGAALNGATGSGYLYPARKITATLGNNANWDIGTIVVTGELNGVVKSETLAVPDAGNTTLTTTGYFDRVTAVAVSAMSGTGGTLTVGLAAMAALTAADFEGVALHTPLIEQDDAAVQGATIFDGRAFDVVKAGAIWVLAEQDVAPGASLFVRVASGAGGSLLGMFRGDADTATAVQVTAEVEESDFAGSGCLRVRFK